MLLPAATWRHPEFRRGARDMAAVAPGIAAWGLVTGVAMIEAGIPLPLAIFMSLVVFAGSAQLAALPLIASAAPVWVVWATAICVNLRFVIFSAQWRPYWRDFPVGQRARLAYFSADLSYVYFMRRFPKAEPSPEQLPYLLGGNSLNWVSWQAASLLGILMSEHVPAAWGLGFAGTLALLGLTCSLLVDRASWFAAGVAACAAIAAYALPLKLNIVVAIAAAVAVGLMIDHGTPRKPAPADDAT